MPYCNRSYSKTFKVIFYDNCHYATNSIDLIELILNQEHSFKAFELLQLSAEWHYLSCWQDELGVNKGVVEDMGTVFRS